MVNCKFFAFYSVTIHIFNVVCNLKITKLILTIISVLTLVSCDIAYSVMVNNHGQTRQVNVNFDNTRKSVYYDSDTLSVRSFDKKTDSMLIRTNIDSTSYSFIVPTNYQVELKPKSLGTPIKSLRYSDS